MTMTRITGACCVEGCVKTETTLTRGMCAMHYRRVRLYGDVNANHRNTGRKPCSIEGCEQPAIGRTWCAKHYQRWQNHHDPLYEPPTKADLGLIPHGTPQGYNYHRCRCEQCMSWKRAYHRSNLLQRYGLDVAAYEWMLQQQDGRCACCGDRPSQLHIDHCHDTGKVRGLLCPNCNKGLGMFKDDPDRLLAAAAYLLQHADVLKEIL